MSAPVLYVLKRYPRLSETFVVRELAALEALGEQLLIDALLPPEDGPRHPEVDGVAASVRYLPRHPRLRRRAVASAHWSLLRRAPRRWLREAVAARRLGLWRRFLQAGLTAERAHRDGVVHLHAHFATAAAEVAGIAGRLSDLPVTVTAHAKDIFHEDNAPALSRRLGDLAGVVTISEHNASHLAAVLPRTPIHHIPNGVAVPDTIPGPAADGSVLCIARLIEKKGVDTLIRALPLVHRKFPEARVEIVGTGPLRSELERLASDLELDGRVSFAGARSFPEVEHCYRRAAMVVLPCRVATDGDRDGVPTVLLEAMARGLPVISTPVAGIPEVVLHEETGLLVPEGDSRALADAIERLLADPGWGHALGRAGRSTVARAHDPFRSGRALQRLFHA